MDQFEHFLRRALKIPPKELFQTGFFEGPNSLFYTLPTPRLRLEIFCSDVKNNRPISKETLEWLADAGAEYLEGKSTFTFALGVEKSKKRGRPAKSKALMAGLRMYALVHCENEKYEVALLQVMEESEMPERSVKRGYAEIRECSKQSGWCQKDE